VHIINSKTDLSWTMKAGRVSSTIMSIINHLHGKYTLSTRKLRLPCILSMASDFSTSITKPLEAYVLEHYPSRPAYAVYPASPTDADQESYTILIVGNKYNNSNYWYFTVSASLMTGTVDGAQCTNTAPNLLHSRARSPSPFITLKMGMYWSRHIILYLKRRCRRRVHW
jgi:hypothetical protein